MKRKLVTVGYKTFCSSFSFDFFFILFGLSVFVYASVAVDIPWNFTSNEIIMYDENWWYVCHTLSFIGLNFSSQYLLFIFVWQFSFLFRVVCVSSSNHRRFFSFAFFFIISFQLLFLSIVVNLNGITKTISFFLLAI